MAIPPVFNQDLGLGYCLQCVGEYKQSEVNGVTGMAFPNWACAYAPCPVGVIAVCYEHIVVNTPSVLSRPNGQIPELGSGSFPIIPGTQSSLPRRSR